MTERRSWGIDLDVLTVDRAEFRHPMHGTELVLARDDWEVIGRPSTLWVAPRPPRGGPDMTDAEWVAAMQNILKDAPSSEEREGE